MLQDRQIERMVLKVERLEQIYSAYLVKKTIHPKVLMEKNGKVTEIKRDKNGARNLSAPHSVSCAKALQRMKSIMSMPKVAPRSIL